MLVLLLLLGVSIVLVNYIVFYADTIKTTTKWLYEYNDSSHTSLFIYLFLLLHSHSNHHFLWYIICLQKAIEKNKRIILTNINKLITYKQNSKYLKKLELESVGWINKNLKKY